MNQIDREWVKTTNEWKKLNPPSHEGYYFCVVGHSALSDGKSDTIGGLQFNLDHDDSRARRPDRKYDLTNLNPICPRHNREKGSRTLKQYLDSKPSLKCGY